MKGAIGKHMAKEDDDREVADDDATESQEGDAPAKAGDDSKAAPDEADAHERTVLAGLQIIFDGQTNPGILKMLQSGAGDPAQAIAQATAMVIQILEEEARKANSELPDTIIMDVADELAGNLLELGVRKGIFQADQNLKGRAAQRVSDMLNDLYPMEPEDAEGLMADKSPEELAQIQSEQTAYAGGV